MMACSLCSPCSDMASSQLAEQWRAIQKPFETFHAQLRDVPHSFQLQNQENVLASGLKCIKGTLESALAVGYGTPLETARARNLLAYLDFQLGDRAQALKQTDLVLDMDSQNLVSIANKAVILWHKGQRTKAEEHVQRLQRMRDKAPEFPYLVVKAKAELAFSYTRCQPGCYPLAESLFAEVIPQAEEPDVWLWKFGLAFTRRRMLQQSGLKDQDGHLDVLRLFMDIVDGCESGSLKAKAYAEMGLLLFTSRPAELKERLQKESGLTVLQACDLALELDGTDNSVLWKCGKLYRYFRENEKSCELLKKAVSLRPTSKAYHNLGLTYKVMALNERQKKDAELKTTNEASGRSNSKVCLSTKNDVPLNHNSEMNVNNETGRTCDSNQCTNGDLRTSSNNKVSYKTDESTSINKEVPATSDSNSLAKRFKEDLYVIETIEHLNLAAKISEWGNSPAIYDLAVFYKTIGELEKAKELLEILLFKETLIPYHKISCPQQLGYILAEMAEQACSEQVRKELLENSQSMHLMALKIAFENEANNPAISRRFGNIWNSFHSLLEAVDKSEQNPAVQLQEKASLFSVIKKNKKSLALLRDIERLQPQKCNDPQYLKLCIENYVAMQQYEEALVFVDLLQCTAQTAETMQLFEDERFLLKVYLQAARQSLQRGSVNYKSYFRTVFYGAFLNNDLCTSSEDTDAEEKVRKKTWDVHILHEDAEEETKVAAGLVSSLADLCGLRATRMDDDVMGGFRLDGVSDIMKRSTMVVVIAGPHKPSRELSYFINMAAPRSTAVSLLMDGGHVPELMKSRRSFALSPVPVPIASAHELKEHTPQKVTAICALFGFLVDIEIDQL